MKYKIKQNGKLKKFEVTGKAEQLFIKYSEIENATDLKKNKLHLSDYHTIPYLLHEIAQTGKNKNIYHGCYGMVQEEWMHSYARRTQCKF